RNTSDRKNVGRRDTKPSSNSGDSERNSRFSSDKSDSSPNNPHSSRDYVRKNDTFEKRAGFSKDSSFRDDKFKAKPYSDRFTSDGAGSYKKRDDSRRDTYGAFRKNANPHARPRIKVSHDADSETPQSSSVNKETIQSSEVRLNRFIANAGYCSRREADDVIRSGKVTVNGKVITELGVKVNPR